jgi:energy-coupling factor transporter ATP-binding protein EcfA2
MPPKKNTPSTSRPFVEKLTTNLKTLDGSPRTIVLGAKTLIVGPNGSGKSAIQQSLQLALVGSADDLVGRVGVKDNGLLMSMVSAERLSIHAKLNNGEDYVFLAKESGRPSHDTGTTALLPLQQVRETLEGSPATARKAFLAWAATEVTTNDILEMVPEIYRGKYLDISAAVGRKMASVDALLATLEYVAKRQREAAKEASGAEALLTSLTDDLDPCPTEEDINAAKWQADLLTKRASAVREAQRQQEFLLQKVSEIRTKLNAPAKPPAPQSNTFERKFYESMAYAASFAAEKGVESCPLCSSPVGKAHISMCGEFYQQQAQALATPLPPAPAVDTAALMAKLNELGEELSRVEEMANLNAGDVEDAATAAQDHYLALRNLADRWANLKRARDTAAEMARESTTYKDMKSELEHIVAELLKRVADTFIARVQTYLPKNWTFGMQFVEAGKEVFRLGLMAGKKLRAALSGAEWATVTCAISMAISSHAGPEQPVLVMPEDRGWDANTLTHVLAAWSGFDGQVVIGTPTKPKKVPVGWTIVELGAAPSDEEEEAATPSIVEAAKTFKVFVPTPTMASMLRALGYTDGAISGMTRESASHIIANGIAAQKD